MVTKGVASVPSPGTQTRIAETLRRRINAIGLQNPGIDVSYGQGYPLPQTVRHEDRGQCLRQDHRGLYRRGGASGDQPEDLLEINISCPNVKEGGIAFG